MAVNAWHQPVKYLHDSDETCIIFPVQGHIIVYLFWLIGLLGSRLHLLRIKVQRVFVALLYLKDGYEIMIGETVDRYSTVCHVGGLIQSMPLERFTIPKTDHGSHPMTLEHLEPIKNPAAVALSKLGASKGGFARAAALSGRKRKMIAKMAAAARWNKQS